MNDKKKTYRLKASYVDRIAIVDNPAVPDAEIVLFKRFDDNEENSITNKNFEESNIIKFINGEQINKLNQFSEFKWRYIQNAVNGAVNALRDSIWARYYSENKESIIEDVTNFLSEFETIVPTLFSITKSETIQTIKFTNDEFLRNIETQLATIQLSNALDFFANVLSGLIYFSSELEDMTSTAKAVISKMKDLILTNLEKIVLINQNKIEKAGRVMSADRLSKLKEAIGTLSNMVTEIEERHARIQRTMNPDEIETELTECSANSKIEKEKSDMEIKEIVENISALNKSIENINKILSEKGLVLTDEQKAEIEKKNQEQKAELEKKANEEKVAAEKLAKEKSDSEAKEKEELNKKFSSIESVLENVCKRFGITSNSIQVEKHNDTTPQEDVFRKTLHKKY